MKHPKRKTIFVVIIALSLVACGVSGAVPTDTPPPTSKASDNTPPPQLTKDVTKPNGEGVEIVNSRSYVDNYGYVHVVGLIRNNTADPVANIKLDISIADANGKSFLRSDDFPTGTAETGTLLHAVAPGNETPFNFWASALEGSEAATYTVKIVDYEQEDILNRGSLEVQNAQMIADSDGNLYLSGELVNLSDQPVAINGFAGAALDSDGNVLAADFTVNLSRYLSPAGADDNADRTPFIVTLDGQAAESTQWSAYWDAYTINEQDPLDVDLEVTTSYYDALGHFHLVGLAHNVGDGPLDLLLVAGLYAADGTVLDAAARSVPVYIQPGRSAPFQFQYFSNVDYNDQQSEPVDSYTVRIDRYGSYETSLYELAFTAVELQSTNEQVNDKGEDVIGFAGDVINSSDYDLSHIVVIVAIYDGDKLVGLESTDINPDGEAFAPGDIGKFDVSIYLDPDIDTTNLEFTTYAQGYFKDVPPPKLTDVQYPGQTVN